MSRKSDRESMRESLKTLQRLVRLLEAEDDGGEDEDEEETEGTSRVRMKCGKCGKPSVFRAAIRASDEAEAIDPAPLDVTCPHCGISNPVLPPADHIWSNPDDDNDEFNMDETEDEEETMHGTLRSDEGYDSRRGSTQKIYRRGSPQKESRAGEAAIAAFVRELNRIVPRARRDASPRDAFREHMAKKERRPLDLLD